MQIVYVGSQGGTSDAVAGFGQTVYQSDVDDVSDQIIQEVGQTSPTRYSSVKYITLDDENRSRQLDPATDVGAFIYIQDNCSNTESFGPAYFYLDDKTDLQEGDWVEISTHGGNTVTVLTSLMGFSLYSWGTTLKLVYIMETWYPVYYNQWGD